MDKKSILLIMVTSFYLCLPFYIAIRSCNWEWLFEQDLVRAKKLMEQNRL